MFTRSKARSESQISAKAHSSRTASSISNTSVVSAKLLKKQLELEAAEEKAQLKLQLEEARVQAQLELVEKRLSLGLAEVASRRSSSRASSARTREWVEQHSGATTSRSRGAHHEHHLDLRIKAEPESAQLVSGNVPFSSAKPQCSPNPSVPSMQGHTSDQALLKLANAVHDLAVGCANNNKMLTIASSTEKMMSRLSTPKELPSFSGDALEWLHFKSFYEESNQVCQFTDSENICRLRKSLHGEARECVSALLMGKKPHMLLASAGEAEFNATPSIKKCSFCHRGSNHAITDCYKFKHALYKDRWQFVRRNRLCSKCLVSQHDHNTCELPLCNINDCGLPHHALLHWTKKPVTVAAAVVDSSVEEEERDCVASIVCDNVATTSMSTPSHVLLKYVRIRIHGPKGDVVTDALLDDGSTITMLDEKLAEEVGLSGCTQSLRVQGAWDNSVLVCQTELLKFEVSGYDARRFKIIARTVKGINLPSQLFKVGEYKHLSKLGEYLCPDTMKPKMIIGQDNYHLLTPLEIIEGDPNATRTVLGWSVHGRYSLQRRPHGVTVAHTFHFSCSDPSEWDRLYDIVKKSYALDALGVSAKPRRCSEDIKALKILDDTSRQVGDHWEVGLPWKNASNELTDSYPTAYSRLNGVVKKMIINKEFQVRYRERIQHLLDNNYAHVYKEAEVSENSKRIWYLPHFGVDNPNKKKLRLVFDAAAKSNGFSLNDYLLQGPDLLVSLFGVLLRFREHRIAVTGDIKDMFLRVQVRPEDQDALRFLWKDDLDKTKAPTVYRMNSLIFGACCSPFIAQYIKNKNALLYEKDKPRAVKCIVQNHYVDDLMDSIETEEEALQLVHDVRDIHKKGGFEIRNWTSNSKLVLSSLPKEDLGSSAVRFQIDAPSEGERTLGLYWFPADDHLAFDMSLKRINTDIIKGLVRPTKRQVLGTIMSVFDALGFLAPVSIRSRILLQDIWRSNITWDQQIRDKEFDKWCKWLTIVERIKTLRIPRWYLKESKARAQDAVSERELHVFCDASPQAFAAVAYWRISHGSEVVVSFIASKSRVSPLRPVSIPRLELQGAILASRLADTLVKEHEIKPTRRFFWTDSSTVLTWISSDARNYKPFVANRLGEIDELTKPEEWRYVPTALNVADFATKENVEDLQFDHPWFHGPEFLSQQKSTWPERSFNASHSEKDLEQNKTAIVVATTVVEACLPEIRRFSSWIRLLRATAFFLKAIEHFKRMDVTTDTARLERAEVLLLKQSQKDAFQTEIEILRDNQSIPKKSRLFKLSPYLDDKGLLRIQGRIDAAQAIFLDTKRPVILDGRHYISHLIIKHYHVLFAHANNETVVNELRQRYWIMHLRPSVRTVTSKCLECRIRKAKPLAPRQGDLPAGRVAHHCRPFSHCGLDLFGPFDVTVGRRREKRYGVIFTCMTVRAIHLEIVHSLSTDSLIMALHRFSARRGWPTDLYSDNGTNLRGADAEFKSLQRETGKYKVNWHFNPPLSPEMGGAWERLIRSVKVTLNVVMKERAPRDETLFTLFCEVEAIVNSRPLTHVSVDPSDSPALTPFHFLLGTSSNLPSISSDVINLCSRKQWRVAQGLADMFWHRWVKEVLPCLLPRTTDTDCRYSLQIGDVVLMVDPSAERRQWPRAVIEALYPGHDGRVRVVDVRTPRGVLRRRSVLRLIPLKPRGAEC